MRVMRRFRSRLESGRFGATILLAIVANCQENTSRPPRTVAITQPLRTAQMGTRVDFTAQAALRVTWTFVIRRVPEGTDRRDPVFSQTIGPQEDLFIRWEGTHNSGIDDFAPGDSCTATVSFPQMAPADADKAVAGFRYH